MPIPATPAGRRFDRVATRYPAHAALSSEVGGRLLERLDGLKFEPQRILDLGSADARQCLALRQRFPRASIIGLDHSRGMLRQARGHQGWWRRRFDLIQASNESLPLAEACVDLAYANLSLAWSTDLGAALNGLRRVMRPGGLVLISMFGPDTLATWRNSSPPLRLNLPDVQALGAALVRAGFAEPVLDTDWIDTLHPHAGSLLADLQGAGMLPAGTSSLGGNAAFRQQRRQIADKMVSAKPVQACWEIVSASAWAPEPGQAIRSALGEEASIPVSAIGRRQRQD